MAGVKSSREALCELLEDDRCLLYAEGRKREEGAKARKGGFTDSQIDEVEEQGGEIALAELLRKRVRYFHDGAAIGCRGFLEEVFRNDRKKFGQRRKEGARRMRGGNWGELMAMRDLRGG